MLKKIAEILMEVSVELTVKDSPYSRARHIKLRKFYFYIPTGGENG